MKAVFRKVPFYFLRHGETDHNVHKIFDDSTEVHLNENGKRQARQVQQLCKSIPLTTVCSSPLLRVQQTKNIVIDNMSVHDVVVEEFRECSSALWRLFLASETRELSRVEGDVIHEFIQRVKLGLEKALEHKGPLLLIAHGGTYWAMTHLLELEGERKIGNCVLTYVTPDSSENWKAEPIL